MNKTLYGVTVLMAGVFLGAGCFEPAQPEGVPTTTEISETDKSSPSVLVQSYWEAKSLLNATP